MTLCIVDLPFGCTDSVAGFCEGIPDELGKKRLGALCSGCRKNQGRRAIRRTAGEETEARPGPGDDSGAHNRPNLLGKSLVR